MTLGLGTKPPECGHEDFSPVIYRTLMVQRIVSLSPHPPAPEGILVLWIAKCHLCRKTFEPRIGLPPGFRVVE